MIGLATVIFVEDVQSNLLAKWLSTGSESLCVQHFKMLDVSKIHICYARSLRTKGKYSTRWLVVSPRLQTDRRLDWKFTKFHEMTIGVYTP